MRFLLGLCLFSFSCFIYADDPDIPSYSGSSPSTSGTTSNSPTTPGSSSDFSSLVQQQTSQAMQTFQNVNYHKLSASENQSDFFSDTGSSDNPPDPSHLFNLFSGS